MPAATAQTDSMIARLEDELDQKTAFSEGLVANAQEANEGRGRDLSAGEMEHMTAARNRIAEIKEQLGGLRELSKIAIESRQRAREINDQLQNARRSAGVGDVEYRSAGAYVADYYLAGMGDPQAQQRLEVFHRVAAHQTTTDNPGLLPERIVEPVLNGVDAARPLVSAIGTTDLGTGSWAYAKVTQGTSVDAQSAEKAELASQKMTITKTSISPETYGGYVNVSKQDISRSTPQILDMIIADLGARYAIKTEDACADDLIAAATASTVDIPASATALNIASAVWGAAGQAAAGLRTALLPATGPILAVAPDKLGVVGPLFPSINPTNAYSSGFLASDVAVQGPQGVISGITVVLGTGLPAGTILFLYRSAVRLYETRYGAMQVNEPSVWGVQVGYAGDFQTVILAAGGIIEIETSA